MQLYAITIEATAQQTITLAAASLEAAQATAKFLFDFDEAIRELVIVEAEQLEEGQA
jgi:hypothetical protein